MITLIPDAGLCNRMRAIDSAIALSEAIHRKLQIYWVKNSALNCGFHDLFEPMPSSMATIIDVNKRPLQIKNPDNLRYGLFKNILKIFQKVYFDRTAFLQEFSKLYKSENDFNELIKNKRILIESHSRFFYSEKKPLYQQFRPLPEIEARIQEITKNFTPNTIGVHIRRSDNSKSIDHSPLELFIHIMKKEIDFNPDTHFFVASDAESIKTELANIFGNKILLSTQEKGDRHTKAGMVNAVIDLYALSRTKKILGSYWSSFSETASHISGIEKITVKKGALPAIYEI